MPDKDKKTAAPRAEKQHPPAGKYMGSVRVGPKGQIVIPKEARDMFAIQPGDTLLLLADVNQGIAIQRIDAYDDFFNQLFQIKDHPQEAED